MIWILHPDQKQFDALKSPGRSGPAGIFVISISGVDRVIGDTSILAKLDLFPA